MPALPPRGNPGGGWGRVQRRCLASRLASSRRAWHPHGKRVDVRATSTSDLSRRGVRRVAGSTFPQEKPPSRGGGGGPRPTRYGGGGGGGGGGWGGGLGGRGGVWGGGGGAGGPPPPPNSHADLSEILHHHQSSPSLLSITPLILLPSFLTEPPRRQIPPDPRTLVLHTPAPINNSLPADVWQSKSLPVEGALTCSLCALNNTHHTSASWTLHATLPICTAGNQHTKTNRFG
jgi:hypothetical protein